MFMLAESYEDQMSSHSFSSWKIQEQVKFIISLTK